MRLLAAVPVLAALSQVDAQGLNFEQIFAKQPALKAIKPSQSSIDRAATASSVISVINENRSKTASSSGVRKTTLATSTKTTSKSSVKASSKTSAKTTSKTSAKSTPKVSTTKGHAARDLSFPTAEVLAGTATSSAGPSCASQPILYSYVPSPNTPNQFLTDSNLTTLANNVLPPAGYTANFTNQYGSIFSGGYIGYYQMSSYNVSLCTSLCDATSGCQAVNLYMERDPIQDPGSSCNNPSAATQARCALYSNAIYGYQATNIGEYRTDFMVVILGSSGYTKNTPPAAQAGFTGPTALAAAVNLNTINGKQVFINSSYTAGSYDPSICSSFCTSTTAKNKAAAAAAGSSTYAACNYFNAFQVAQNGTKLGTYCQLYTTSAASQYANLYTEPYNGVTYTVINSYGYNLTSQDSGTQSVSSVSTSTSTAATSSSTSSAVVASTTSSSSTSTKATTTTATPAAATLQASCAQLGNSYTDSNGVTYTVDCAHDLLGVGDIGNTAVSSFAACFAACDIQSGCQAIAYVGGTGAGTCYFKSLKGVTAQPNAQTTVDLAWLPAAYTGLSTTSTSAAKATATA